MKRIALIGHRGVGKTALLGRVSSYIKIPTYDLDARIAQKSGRLVNDIFREDGEPKFRELEIAAYHEIPAGDAIVAFGAGFPVDKIDSSWHVIWVRRATDENGRIFTDRPRLESALTALEEFQLRKITRDPQFAARADAVLFIDEGADDVEDPAERAYFTGAFKNLGGALTVMPDAFSRSFEAWVKLRLAWGLRWFELRDDLLTEDQMSKALQLLPREKILVSLRNPMREHDSLARGCAFDWPAERGRPRATPTYLSLHARSGTLGDSLAQLTQLSKTIRTFVPVKLKAALPVYSFDELLEGHRWQIEDSVNRVFLPMSEDGRWSWYRLFRHHDLSLNFIRESSGSASDQPTLLQWARFIPSKKFAAVLGDPVKQSRTPMEQADFFRKRNKNVFAIQMNESEWRSVSDLVGLGLTDAAVTAPLKQKAFEFARSVDAETQDLKSLNTLHFETREGTNTDLKGLQHAVARNLSLPQNAVVWGGGGTLNVITKVFPHAELVSVRTKLTRENRTPKSPDLVIWAASLKPDQAEPPAEWKPTHVLDLNYSEASVAREYAVKTGAKYISGLAMFEGQAQAQREFWAQFPPEDSK